MNDGTLGGRISNTSEFSSLESASSSPSRVSRKEDGDYTKEGFLFHIRVAAGAVVVRGSVCDVDVARVPVAVHEAP